MPRESVVVSGGRTARPAAALSAARSLLRARPGLVVVPALALLLWLVYGSGYVDYDALYALVWGQDLVAGHLPTDLTALHSPTSHPLDTVLAVVVSPLSRAAALDTFQAVSLLSFAGLGWAAFRLGERLFAPATGAVLALIVLTRPVLVHQALTANIDVPFLALVVAAAAMEAARPRRGWPVLATLAVAGLLRPEAWLLGLAYVVWLWPAVTNRGRARAVALALVAPVLWLLFDLWLAGDALHSLHGTSRAATRIGRPQGLGRAIRLTPSYLAQFDQLVIAVGGAIVAVLALWRRRRQALLPVTLGALGGLGFLVLGVANLPLLARYLAVPATMLALFFAAGVTAWWIPDVRSAHRRAAAALTVVFALLFVIAAITNVPHVRDRVNEARDRHTLDAALPGLVESSAGRRALTACGPLQVDYFQTRPLLAYLLDRRRVESLGVVNPPDARTGVLLLPRHGARGVPPPTFRPLAGNAQWTILANCRGRAR
jgi:hypothetical protein